MKTLSIVFICVDLKEDVKLILKLASGGSRIFPRGAPTPKVGVLTNFSGRKQHENVRIWTPGGASLAPP